MSCDDSFYVIRTQQNRMTALHILNVTLYGIRAENDQHFEKLQLELIYSIFKISRLQLPSVAAQVSLCLLRLQTMRAGSLVTRRMPLIRFTCKTNCLLLGLFLKVFDGTMPMIV